jgi:transposase
MTSKRSLRSAFPPSTPLPDAVTEMDEMFQNAGEKGIPHKDPADPPRRRGNPRPGHGTFANDRPPIVGVVGREDGEVRMDMVEHTDKATLNAMASETTAFDAVVNTDEWGGSNDLEAMGHPHPTVCHGAREWARDEDGDGVREVHTNTIEGIWTGVRNYLRMFRGVSKWFLAGYVATFAAVYNAVWIDPLWLSQALRVSSPRAT